jgi:hypothetical protein
MCACESSTTYIVTATKVVCSCYTSISVKQSTRSALKSFSTVLCGSQATMLISFSRCIINIDLNKIAPCRQTVLEVVGIPIPIPTSNTDTNPPLNRLRRQPFMSCVTCERIDSFQRYVTGVLADVTATND